MMHLSAHRLTAALQTNTKMYAPTQLLPPSPLLLPLLLPLQALALAVGVKLHMTPSSDKACTVVGQLPAMRQPACLLLLACYCLLPLALASSLPLPATAPSGQRPATRLFPASMLLPTAC